MLLKIECGIENKNINVFHNISILELRRQIADLFELKPENFDLQYAQVYLMDGKSLSVYGISENSVVRIVNQKLDLKLTNKDSENSVVRAVNQKLNLKIINKDSEVLLKQLDINMKVGELKKQYSPANWQNLKFYYFYEFSVDNPNKKNIDMKIVDDKLNPKTITTEQKKEELRKKYLEINNGDRLYYFYFINLIDNELTLAQHYMNDDYKIYITFPIFIKHSGSAYSFDVCDKLLISHFKELIKNKIDKSMLDFELIYNGQTLQGLCVIGDYEINENDTLMTTSTIIGGV